MFRIASVLATGVVAVLLSPVAGTAQPKGVDVGKPVEGELGAKKQTVYFRAEGATSGIGSGSMYVHSAPITLKAGQTLSMSVTVTGKDRLVGLVLLDPTGKQLLGSSDATQVFKKTAALTVEDVNVSGKYTIVVFSDLIGPFTLQTAGSEEELTKKGLEDKIARLKKELKQAEDALEAVEKKEKK